MHRKPSGRDVVTCAIEYSIPASNLSHPCVYVEQTFAGISEDHRVEEVKSCAWVQRVRLGMAGPK